MDPASESAAYMLGRFAAPVVIAVIVYAVMRVVKKRQLTAKESWTVVGITAGLYLLSVLGNALK